MGSRSAKWQISHDDWYYEFHLQATNATSTFESGYCFSYMLPHNKWPRL
jgi:hypothetical protein